jgi:TetR/AcrR family transcriptional repressor of lmrAB and yxaGH operons
MTSLSACSFGAGTSRDRARRLARLAITSIEGALILARVEQSGEPILAMAEDIATLIAAARPA